MIAKSRKCLCISLFEVVRTRVLLISLILSLHYNLLNICDEHILFFETCLVQGFVRVITCESADPSTFVHGQI